MKIDETFFLGDLLLDISAINVFEKRIDRLKWD